MSDLMSQSLSFDDLQKKYSNFFVPSFSISIDGSELSKTDLQLESLNMQLTLLDAAGSCRFTLINAYDGEKKKFNGFIGDKIKPGAKVTVKLGYGKSLEQVFLGFVMSREAVFPYDKMPHVRVLCLDGRRLMMDNHARDYFLKKSRKQIIQDILGKYSKMIDIEKIDAPTKAGETVGRHGTDFDYVMKIAAEENKVFSVLNGKAYFADLKSKKTPCASLTYGEGLISFERENIYKNLSVRVIGAQEDEPKPVVGNNEKEAAAGQVNASEAPMLIIPRPSVADAENAKKLAQNLYLGKKSESVSGRGLAIGIPDIVPGRYIKLDGLDPAYNKKYFVTEVCHELDAKGFFTSFEVGEDA